MPNTPEARARRQLARLAVVLLLSLGAHFAADGAGLALSFADANSPACAPASASASSAIADGHVAYLHAQPPAALPLIPIAALAAPRLRPLAPPLGPLTPPPLAAHVAW